MAGYPEHPTKTDAKSSTPHPSKKSNHVLGLTPTLLFGALTAILLARYDWPLRWLLSGAPILSFLFLFGSWTGHRVLPMFPLSTLLLGLNLAYAIAGTSWLLYYLFAAQCYPAIMLTCLFQFETVANVVRRGLRSLIKQMHFVHDKIVFFDIPALEIDTDVEGLLAVRGLTISLSTLTIVAHGIEVGIKLSDDLELAILTDKVSIALFRRIEIGDTYANLKGGHHEMTFGHLEGSSHDSEGDSIMEADTPLLKAASTGDLEHHQHARPRPNMVKMTSRMTSGKQIVDSPVDTTLLNSMTRVAPDDGDGDAQALVQDTLKWINDTSSITQTKQKILRASRTGRDTAFDYTDRKDMRAAICSLLHDRPSVPHPPKLSIKVTTLQKLTHSRVRHFMHRLPMLLRLLLSPISYFHPISISAITASGSGKWINRMLGANLFRGYSAENSDLRKIEARISAWLTDANFALELVDLAATAQVPFLTEWDITTSLSISDVLAYRTLPKIIDLNEVIRLGGADATFKIPSFLLPHHEHLLPPVPTPQDKEAMLHELETADGIPKLVQKQHDLEQLEKDEANVGISTHVRLPAVLDQELLNFVAAVVKASKVVEMEGEGLLRRCSRGPQRHHILRS